MFPVSAIDFNMGWLHNDSATTKVHTVTNAQLRNFWEWQKFSEKSLTVIVLITERGLTSAILKTAYYPLGVMRHFLWVAHLLTRLLGGPGAIKTEFSVIEECWQQVKGGGFPSVHCWWVHTWNALFSSGLPSTRWRWSYWRKILKLLDFPLWGKAGRAGTA